MTCGFVQALSILENIGDNDGVYTANFHNTWREQSAECDHLEGDVYRTCKLDRAYEACEDDYEGDGIEWCRDNVRNRVSHLAEFP